MLEKQKQEGYFTQEGAVRPSTSVKTSLKRTLENTSYAKLENKQNQNSNEAKGKSQFRSMYLTIYPIAEGQVFKESQSKTIQLKSQIPTASDELVYKLYRTEGRLVKSILEHNGFTWTETQDWNLLWLGTSGKPYMYQNLSDYQRINHFPNTTEITRKDNLCINITTMQQAFGKDQFNIIPDTFILPDQKHVFIQQFALNPGLWIVKPCASSRGRGIIIAKDIQEVPIDDECIVQRYINNPYLINNLKFDLRIYVLITSFDPLKIYVYEEGLTRFASEAYTTRQNNTNKFMHLTNYSVNKKSRNFVQNKDATEDNVGHKWSLSALFKFLKTKRQDTDALWNKIYDLIIKTVISIEPLVVAQVKRYGIKRHNCFDLLGFDVLLDDAMKPWLIEVNLSPSMNNDSPLDHRIKTNLLADTLTLIGLRRIDRRQERMNAIRSRGSSNIHVSNSRAGTSHNKTRESFNMVLREIQEEHARRGGFVRIYPAQGSDQYDEFFDSPRYSNKMIYRNLFSVEVQQKNQVSVSTLQIYHEEEHIKPLDLGSNTLSNKKTNLLRQTNFSLTPRRFQKSSTQNMFKNMKRQNKVSAIVTTDDILIEYIGRIYDSINGQKDCSIAASARKSLELFVDHYVWTSTTDREESLQKRIRRRYNEMQDRRSRIIESSQARQPRNKKLKELSIKQIEILIQKNSKGPTAELVAWLFYPRGRGVLTEIIAFQNRRNRKNKTKNPEEEQESEEGSKLVLNLRRK